MPLSTITTLLSSVLVLAVAADAGCVKPMGAVSNWFYNSKSNGPYSCIPESKPWAMLNSYRSGGDQNVHWKYTNDPNDSECLTNWVYTEANGKDVRQYIRDRLATEKGSGRTWCALPVYRSGGVEFQQWARCTC